MEPKAGDLVYGPYPVITSDRNKANHYCLVLEVFENKTMLVALGTSSHIDSVPLDHELLISEPADLRKLMLRRATRFDLKQIEVVEINEFQEHATLVDMPKLLTKLERAARFAGLI
jgi:hypothetical protein